MRFLQYSLISNSFLVLLRCSFFNFFSIHLHLFDSVRFRITFITMLHFLEYFIPALVDGLSDSKSPQVSRGLLTRPLISKSSTTSINHVVTVASTLRTTDTTVTFMFHSFFSSLAISIVILLLGEFFFPTSIN